MKLIITDLLELPVQVEGEYRVIQPREPIASCAGCFGCWIKTPGRCVLPDSYRDTGILMGKTKQLLIVSRCCYGCVSPFVKAVQDRAISYVHPDFILREGRMHHKRRYQNRIAISAWFYGEDVTEAEKETARNLIQANNENYGGRVAEVLFFDTPEQMGGMTL